MGLSKINEIAEVFINSGREKEAFGIISNGSLENQNVVIGSADTIVQMAEQKRVKAPATIVIGEVVKFALNNFKNQSILSFN
jgi:uroporphyrin-III C-methyltransferase